MKRLLIANRGEIARRIIRTAHAMGIATVAVHSDVDAAALHVAEATQAVALGGDTAAQSYLRIEALIAAARASGADALHPGYGFLSESPDFAQAVIDAGLIWVGPPPAAIRALGNKSGVKRLAMELGVPCLPGYAGADQSDARFASEAARIGVPLMVKAAAGGGGRGMRLVQHADELAAALASARSEAASAFGDGELLLERALRSPRHVEVQVFADAHGHCIHLGERDCSVQRRHQKLIEESPSPAVDAALRQRLGESAIRLAQAAGYVGAGTVEFLLEGALRQAQADREPQFFLMEMNTRLQVEHPVTEAVTGFDLVEWQLRVARGEPLPATQREVVASGHAIEVRLCAEDEAFAPHTGVIRRFVAPDGVRFDHALHEGMSVTPHYDSMLGKLIAHAPTRDQAIARLAGALERLVVLGLPTNRGLLIECLRDPRFRRGEAGIAFLADHGEAIRAALRERETRDPALVVAALWVAMAGPRHRLALAPPFERPMRLRLRGRVIEARLCEQPADRLRVTADGAAAEEVRVLAGHARLAQGGVDHTLHIAAVDTDEWHLQIDGTDRFVADESWRPASNGSAAQHAIELRAPFNGRVVALHAAAQQDVSAGATLIVIESMKLEHAIAAPRSGRLASVAVEIGQQVATQQLLMSFEAAA
ncbi:acetyl/propionyl/methylcrotonyl-CoA carboxylase subunit alpha [Piscinibacter sp.]|uniref:acetyl/propionyl/methylcrotonyl-CoA carboxylase subunit alpha n=1 Tax=Piscinibacter sp. TaxID=1903157 RepID=UPI002F3FAAB7